MKKLLLLSMVVSAVAFLASCKEETPAEEIENTTMKLEKEAENPYRKAIKQAEEVTGAKAE